jgi:endonuclease-8
MVEGPGATRNADKARLLVGCTMVAILPGKLQVAGVLQEVLSVGKEVFLIFDDQALRLHFGMNGSLTIRKDATRELPSWRKREPPSLVIRLKQKDDDDETILECRATTVNQVSAFVANSKIQRLAPRDVCSPYFDTKTVLDALLQRPAAMISDVLLDQARFPGVGNIIKIEGLHRSKLHPQDQVSLLSEDELLRVITECRKYAFQWYQRGRAPPKLVYNQLGCQTCSGKVQIQKLGEDLSRTTFWCGACQPRKPKDGFVVKAVAVYVAVPVTTQQEGPPKLACPQHGMKPCKLRRVRKSDTNQGRLFACCQARDCPYFQWADTHLPQCCGVPILRISKTAKTGGKWFLSCARCKLFAWAKPKDLAPLVCRLTPLL